MILQNNINITASYKGRSKYEFWQFISVNDIINVSLILQNPGRSSRGLYATLVTLNNQTRGHVFTCSISDMNKYLDKIKYADLGPTPVPFIR